MSVFVDTGVWYAYHDRDATRHDRAASAFQGLLSGRYGRLYTSDYVYDEAVTLTRRRTGSLLDAKRIGDRIRGVGDFPRAAELLVVPERTFEAAIDAFERYRAHALSFTDATTIALMDEHGIDSVVSFDDDFDGVVDRLDPVEL